MSKDADAAVSAQPQEHFVFEEGAGQCKRQDALSKALQGCGNQHTNTAQDRSFVYRCTDNQRTALTCACHKGRTQCVLSLLQHGADVHKAALDG